VQTLRGSYIVGTHGFDIVGGVAQPIALVEGINFNGDGTLVSPFATVSVNGTILQFGETVGSYTVEASGQGTLTFTGIASFDIFVEANGKQVWMIETDPNTVFQGTATKVSR
jgi:carbon monoxide dehydrogenase subunit G